MGVFTVFGALRKLQSRGPIGKNHVSYRAGVSNLGPVELQCTVYIYIYII